MIEEVLPENIFLFFNKAAEIISYTSADIDRLGKQSQGKPLESTSQTFDLEFDGSHTQQILTYNSTESEALLGTDWFLHCTLRLLFL